MGVIRDEVYLGTVLLERSRWAKGPKQPSFRVSEWLDRIGAAGFDGIELWQYHGQVCGGEEQRLLAASAVPVTVFNTYCRMNDEDKPLRDECTQLAQRYGSRAMKFNVGSSDEGTRPEFLRSMREWRQSVPGDMQLLCECHPRTYVEEPAFAKQFFDELGPGGWQVIVHPLSRFDTLESWMRLFGPMVAHAHMQVRDEGRVVRLERCGQTVRDAIGIMRDNGYGGSWTIEFTEGTATPDESIERLFDNAVRDMDFLRECLA